MNWSPSRSLELDFHNFIIGMDEHLLNISVAYSHLEEAKLLLRERDSETADQIEVIQKRLISEMGFRFQTIMEELSVDNTSN